MTWTTAISAAGVLAAFALTGLGLGLVYFSILRRTAALYVAGRNGFGALLFTLGRLLATAAVLLVAARTGAAALLATFVGFLIARAVAVRAAIGSV